MVWQISWYIYDTRNSCWVWVDPSEPVINSAWFVHMYHYSRVILSLTGGIIFPTPVYQLILNRTRLIRYSYTQSPRWVFSWHVLVYTVSILSVKIDDVLPKDVWFDVSEFQRSPLTQTFYFKDATGKLRPDEFDQAVAFLISPPKDVGHSTSQTFFSWWPVVELYFFGKPMWTFGSEIINMNLSTSNHWHTHQ